MDSSKDKVASQTALPERTMADTSTNNDSDSSSDSSFEILDYSPDSSPTLVSDSDKDKDELIKNYIRGVSRRRMDLVNKFRERFDKEWETWDSDEADSILQRMILEMNSELSKLTMDSREEIKKLIAASPVSTDEKSVTDFDLGVHANKTTQTSTTETQCVATETESKTTCVETQTPAAEPEIIANSSDETDGKSKKDSTISDSSNVDSKDMQIFSLSLENNSMKAKIERLENELSTSRFGSQIDEKFSLERCSMQRNIDEYLKKADEMNSCFVSTQSRYAEEQRIIGECANLINLIDSLGFTDDNFMTVNEVANFDKTLKGYFKQLKSVQVQVVEERQRMIGIEKHYQKILSDYRNIVHELNAVQLENEKMALTEKDREEKHVKMEKKLVEREKKLSAEKAKLAKQRRLFNEEKVKLHEAMANSIRTLEQEKEKLTIFPKNFGKDMDRLLGSFDLSLNLKQTSPNKDQQAPQQQNADQHQSTKHVQMDIQQQQAGLLLSDLLGNLTHILELLKQQQTLLQQQYTWHLNKTEQTPLSLSYVLENMTRLMEYDLKNLQTLHQQNAQPAASMGKQQQNAKPAPTATITSAQQQTAPLQTRELITTFQAMDTVSANTRTARQIHETVAAYHSTQASSASANATKSQQSKTGKCTDVWKGTLEWADNTKATGTVEVPFQVFQAIKNGVPEVDTESWPTKLTVYFIPHMVMGSLGRAYLNKFKSVAFTPTSDGDHGATALKEMKNIMSIGYVGCAYLSPATSSNINVLLLYYTAANQAFTGYVPMDQQAYVARLMKSLLQLKSATALLSANLGTGSSILGSVTVKGSSISPANAPITLLRAHRMAQNVVPKNNPAQQPVAPTTTQQNQIKINMSPSATEIRSQGQINTSDGQNNGPVQQPMAPTTTEQSQINTQAVGPSAVATGPQGQINMGGVTIGQQQETLEVAQQQQQGAQKESQEQSQQTQNDLNPGPGIQKPQQANAQSRVPNDFNPLVFEHWDFLRPQIQRRL